QQAHQSVVMRIALAHAHFEAVHPFPNGNGRTGRLLLPLMLAADGHTPLYLAPYIAANKPTYIDALRAAQQRLEYPPLVELMSNAITSAADTAEAAHRDLSAVAEGWRTRKRWRRNSAALRAIELLPGYPVVTAKRLAQQLRVSGQAANSAIQQ